MLRSQVCIIITLWGSEIVIILSCLTNLKSSRQDIDAFQVTLLLGPGDRWTVQLLERSTEICVLCMEPECFLVFFDFILQPMRHRKCSRTWAFTGLVPYLPSASRAYLLVIGLTSATVSNIGTCRYIPLHGNLLLPDAPLIPIMSLSDTSGTLAPSHFCGVSGSHPLSLASLLSTLDDLLPN